MPQLLTSSIGGVPVAWDISANYLDVSNNLNVNGDVTANNFIGNITGNLIGDASIAINLAGGAGGSIPFQSAVDTTSLLANGTAGQVLTSQGTTLAPIFATPSSTKLQTRTTTAYTSLTTNSTWTLLATITGTNIFTGTGNYSLNWGFSSTETNKFNAIMAIGSSDQFRPFFNIFSYNGITWNSINSARTIGKGAGEKSQYNEGLKLWFSGGGAVIPGIFFENATAPFYLSKNGIDWSVLVFPFSGSPSNARVIATNGTGTFVYGGTGSSNILSTSVGDLGKPPTNIALVANGPTTDYGTLCLIWVAGSINKFVMTGGSGATQNSMWSNDGITWNLSNNYGSAIVGRVLEVNTAQNFIVSGGASMNYSTDGVIWTAGVVNGSIDDTNGLAFGDNMWVRVGSGANPLHYSTDGITWNIVTATGLTSGLGVVYYSSIGKWVIVGTGTSSLYTSPNAINWTAITSDYFAVSLFDCNLAQGVITTQKNMEVGIVVKNTTSSISQYPLNYGVTGGNFLGRQCVFDSVSGSASANDTIDITSYNAGTMDIEIWGKLDADTPISFGTTPSLTATISATPYV